MMAFRNARYASPDNATIDMEIDHPAYGWIPFTASPVDEAGRDFFAAAMSGSVSAYVAPAAEAYQIPKTLPWKRMTPDEAAQLYAQMQLTDPQVRAIYEAAQYLSSDDDLWGTLHEIIATTLGSSQRADELLAPES